MSGSTVLIPITINPFVNTRDNTPSFVINALPDGVSRSNTVNLVGNNLDLEDGDFILWRLSTNTSVEYTIDSVSFIAVGASGETINASGFSLELDTGDTLSGTQEPLTGFFGGDFNSSTALTSLIPLIEANWTGTTTEDVTSTVGTSQTSPTIVFNRKDETGGMRTNGWDLVDSLFDSGKRKGNSSIDYSVGQTRTDNSAGSWDRWVNTGVQKTWIGTDPSTDTDGTAFKVILDNAIGTRADLVNTTLQLTANNAAAASATFVVTRVAVLDFGADYWFEIDSFALDGTGAEIRSGDPVFLDHNGTEFGWNAVFILGSNDSSSMVINTTSTGTIVPDWSIPSQGRGVSGTTSFSNADGMAGGGTVSTYTVVDHNGTTIGTVNGSVTDASLSDASTVNTAIEGLIDSTTELNTNFNASVSGNDIVITADTAGEVTGTWSITANHSSGTGTLAYGNAVIAPNGANAGTTGNDTWSVTINGTEYTDTFTSEATANEQATQIATFLNAQS